MAKIISIQDGVGTGQLINGSYTVTSDVVGYENSSIDPASITVAEGTNSYAFTISASGTLTLHVTDDGTISGNPIVGATFVRTDSNGIEYGSPITSDVSGNAVFNNVPYAESNAPTIYFKQTASDGDHEFVSTVQSTVMTASTQTNEIQNPVGATRTINLTDENYANLPIESGTITLTN